MIKREGREKVLDLAPSIPKLAGLHEASFCVLYGVITDAHGGILARGRNRICEQVAEGKQLCGHRLAHAEMNALIQIDWSTVETRTCILYTTTEPCPF